MGVIKMSVWIFYISVIIVIAIYGSVGEIKIEKIKSDLKLANVRIQVLENETAMLLGESYLDGEKKKKQRKAKDIVKIIKESNSLETLEDQIINIL